MSKELIIMLSDISMILAIVISTAAVVLRVYYQLRWKFLDLKQENDLLKRELERLASKKT